MTAQNVNSIVQNSIDQINARFAAAEKDIQAIEAFTGDISDLDSAIAKLLPDEYHEQALPHGGFCMLKDWTVAEEISELKNSITGFQGQIKSTESDLEQMNPGFESLNSTVNGLISAVQTAALQGVGSQEVADDITKISGYLQSLFQAMQDKLSADRYQNLLSINGLSQSQIEKYATDMVDADGQEQGVLCGLMDSMSSDYTAYDLASNDAQEQMDKYTFFETYFDIGGADQKSRYDNEVVSNANVMQDAIASAIGNLTPEMASLNPEFTELNLVLHSEFKKIKEILNNSNLTTSEKRAKILAITMFLVTFFRLVQQQSESQKAQNQQRMSKANINAAKMNMHNMMAAQTVQEELAKRAKEMQAIMRFTQLFLGAVFTLLAPGVGSALLMGLITVLSFTGATSKVTQDLAGAIGGSHGQLYAALIVSAAEIIVTAGGGAALDSAIVACAGGMIKTATSSAMEKTELAIEQAAKSAAANAGKAGNAKAIASAQRLLTETVLDAANTAAKKTARQFLSQTFANLLELIGKKAFTNEMQATISASAKEAAENALAASAKIALRAAEGNAVGIQLAEQESLQIAETAANKAVAESSHQTVGSVSRSALRTAAIRTGAATLYSLGSTNLLLQIVEDAMKAHGKDLDNKAKTGLIATQEILQIIAMLLGSGALSSASFENLPGNLVKIGAVGQVLPMGANSIMNFDLGSIQRSSADATEKLQVTQMLATLLQLSLDQMQQDSSLERDRFTREQQAEIQSEKGMAGHLLDGDQAGIQILIQQAV